MFLVTMVPGFMIISCPSCETRYNLPSGHIAADGSLIRCAECGHSWVEATAIEIPELTYEGPILDHDDRDRDDRDIESEAERIAKAARQAAEAAAVQRRLKRKTQLGWAVLAASIALPVAAAAAFPDTIVRTLPAASKLYAMAGTEVKINHFEIRKVEQQHLRVDNQRVLAIRGEVTNTGQRNELVPGLVFRLLDKSGKEVYSWVLNATAVRSLPGGEATTFVTRVADPPETAEKVEIGFANETKIGSIARP